MFLLDTNTVSYLLRGNQHIIQKLGEINHTQICLCSVVISELYYGAMLHPSKKDMLMSYYSELFSATISFPFDTKSALTFAQTKVKLQTSGNTIDDIDLQIASICLANDLTLVTNNIKHFAKVPRIKLENWVK